MTLTDLADVLKQLQLVSCGGAKAALREQADELTGTYHLARDGGAMSDRLQASRKQTDTRYAQLTS